MKRNGFLIFTLCAVAVTGAVADDWPNYLGPERDQIWRETGVVETIPEDGPEILWRAPVGLGYSGPAVAHGRVYLTDYELESGEIRNNPSGKNELEGRERVRCFDAETGEEIWTHAYDRPYFLSYAAGPRATPTVNDGRVYALGAEGDLLCLDAETGEVLWRKNFQEEYGAETPIWGFAAHPLVDGDTVYCVAGGEGSVAVALDKATGEEKWTALSATEPGYCPPSIIEQAGVRQLIIWHAESLESLNPEDGSVYWSKPLQPGYGMAIAPPRQAGDRLFATGHGKTAALYELGTETPSAEQIWKANPRQAIFCANSTPHVVDGIIYGCNTDSSALTAARLEDGERLWETLVPTLGSEDPERMGRHGTAFLTRHGPTGSWFLFSETGDLITAELSPEGYTETGRAHVLEPTNEAFGRPVVWSPPAFAMKSAFLRNDEELIRVDLSASE